jgi:hypothetical protein
MTRRFLISASALGLSLAMPGAGTAADRPAAGVSVAGGLTRSHPAPSLSPDPRVPHGADLADKTVDETRDATVTAGLATTPGNAISFAPAPASSLGTTAADLRVGVFATSPKPDAMDQAARPRAIKTEVTFR